MLKSRNREIQNLEMAMQSKMSVENVNQLDLSLLDMNRRNPER